MHVMLLPRFTILSPDQIHLSDLAKPIHHADMTFVDTFTQNAKSCATTQEEKLLQLRAGWKNGGNLAFADVPLSPVSVIHHIGPAVESLSNQNIYQLSTMMTMCLCAVSRSSSKGVLM